MKKQIPKYSITMLTLLFGVMLFSLPAFAGPPAPTVVANGSTTCSGFCLTFAVNGLGSNYYGPVTGSIQYTLTLTSTTGGQPITVSGTVPFSADGSQQICGVWNSGGQPITGNFQVSGTAVLTTSEGQTVSVPIEFSNSSLNCTIPPPTLTMANGTTTCIGYCLSFTATNLTPGETGDKIVYTITLTPTAGGPPITVSGEVDFTAPASGTFSIDNVCGNWLASGQNVTNSYTVSGTATLVTSSGQSMASINFTNSSLNCGPPPPGKPFAIGPSSMEGSLTIKPGDWISGGYNFKFTSNNHPATAYTVTATVTVPVVCPDNSIQDIVIPLGIPGALNGGGVTTYTFNIPAGDTTNHASNDQNSILVWEGAVQAPATLCGGVPGKNQRGAIFNATVSQTPQAGLVNWQFHYRDPNAKGKGNVNCTDASNPLRNHADVCGASWSQTVTDP